MPLWLLRARTQHRLCLKSCQTCGVLQHDGGMHVTMYDVDLYAGWQRRRRTRLLRVRLSPTGVIRPTALVLTACPHLMQYDEYACARSWLGPLVAVDDVQPTVLQCDLCQSTSAAWAAALADIDVAIAEKRCLDALNSIKSVPERVKMPDTSLM